MKVRRDILPAVIGLIFLIMAREIYPYAGVMVADPIAGFEVEEIASGLGGPTCLVFHQDELLVCDRDGGRIITVDGEVILDGLNYPHGLVFTDEYMVVSEKGSLTRYDLDLSNKTVLVDGIKSGNHQTNAVNLLPNGTLIWHAGSTCNLCDEADEHNAALLWVDVQTGDYGVLASGVRNSFDGIWIDDIGYLFSDNGQDAMGDGFPVEEVNLLVEGADYGWLVESPEDPNPDGTEAPIAWWTPHTSLNGLTTRPANFPGDNHTIYGTVYGSWATLIPRGHQIVRIDFTNTSGGWVGEVTVFASDVGTPLPITAGPDGNLYYGTFDHSGAVYKISPEAKS
jgi:glucose/arabinose dehydrogenase